MVHQYDIVTLPLKTLGDQLFDGQGRLLAVWDSAVPEPIKVAFVQAANDYQHQVERNLNNVLGHALVEVEKNPTPLEETIKAVEVLKEEVEELRAAFAEHQQLVAAAYGAVEEELDGIQDAIRRRNCYVPFDPDNG